MYDMLQRRSIARELAVASGNVEEAVARLRLQYETFDRLATDTVRKMTRDPKFMQLVREQERSVIKARKEVEHERERLGAIKDLVGKKDIEMLCRHVIARLSKKALQGDLESAELLLKYVQIVVAMQAETKPGFRPEDIK